MTLNSFQTSGNSPGHGGCRVGLLGYGASAAAIARRLTAPDSPSTIRLTHVCDRRARERRAQQPEILANLHWTDRFDDLLTSDIDIVMEAGAGSEPVYDYLRAALLAGKSVVTLNRQVVAHHGPALLTLAERQGRQFRYEGAVGGALPIVRLLADGFCGDRVRSIDAILSGSSNAVLSKMDEDGCVMDDAIADACARGYADADPSADLEGVDAATKLAILCALAFGLRVLPSQIETRGTGRVDAEDFRRARQRSGTIRQVAHAAYDPDSSSLVTWVAPIYLPNTAPLARVVGPQNAALITGVYAGEVFVAGKGAGVDAAAVAAIGDLTMIARDRAAIVPAPVLKEPKIIKSLTDIKLAEAV